MKHWMHFPYAILAGMAISMGGYILLRTKDAFAGGNVVGALLFTFGLMMVCTRGYNLFTGKVCYLLDQPNKASYLLDLGVIWIGNVVGCAIAGALVNLTAVCGVSAGMNVTAAGMVEAKMQTSYLSLFVLGIICNIFIYLAVDSYKNNPHEVGKYCALFLGVSGFIIAGSEHCIADAFYWCCSKVIYEQPLASLACLIVISLGNSVGGLALPVVGRIHKKMHEAGEAE